MSDPKSPLAQLIGATRRALMLFALSVSVAHAQSAAPAGTGPAFTPTRPVTLIVPFPPGGGTDAVGRAVAERLSQLWGQQMIVDNRAGAQGNVGSAQAARQPGDGYTVLLAHHFFTAPFRARQPSKNAFCYFRSALQTNQTLATSRKKSFLGQLSLLIAFAIWFHHARHHHGVFSYFKRREFE